MLRMGSRVGWLVGGMTLAMLSKIKDLSLSQKEMGFAIW